MARIGERQRLLPDIWPGFVDALAALLVIIIFLVMIFTVAQFFLSEILSGRDRALENLNRQVSAISELLSLERTEAERLSVDTKARIAALGEEIAARDVAIAQLRAGAERLGTELAAEREQRTEAERTVVETRTELAAERTAGAAARAEIETLGARLEELARDLAAREETVAGLAARNEELDGQLSAERQRAAAAEKAAADTGRDLERVRAELATEKKAGKAARAEIAVLNARLAEIVRDLAARDQTISGLAARNEELTGRLSAERQRAGEAEREVVDTGRSLALTRAELAEERKAGEAARLQAEELASALRAERARAAAAEKEATDTAGALDRARAELATEKKAGAETRSRAEALEERLAGREERVSQLTVHTAELEARLSAERTRAGQAEREAESQARRIEETARQAETAGRELAGLRDEMVRLNEALDVSETTRQTQETRIADLDKRLSRALVSKVTELAQYRSEFFGRLREVLGSDANIRVVGDRFVFQSEILFASGEATFTPFALEQVAKLATTLKEVSERIPEGIDWVLRVDGHTDRAPISTPRFPSNWELSTGRAINVVRELIGRGIPASRLVAAGFGSNYPLDDRETPEAYSRNRRIELKLTQR